MKRNLCLAFALALPLTLYAESGNAPATKKDTLVAKKQAAATAARTDTLTTRKEVAGVPDTAARKHLGRLSIVSTPPQGEVDVDSLPKGESPLVVDSLTPGTHIVIVKAKGYFGKKVIVDVPADSTVSLAVLLVAPAHLVVISDPPGATALVDGKEIGATPCDNPRLKPGDHAVKIDKAGFLLSEKRVSLTEGKTDTISFVLRPAPGAIATPQRPESAPKKRGFNRVLGIVALSAFVLFGVVLLGVELQSAK